MPSKPSSAELPWSTGRTRSPAGHGCLCCSPARGAGLGGRGGSASHPTCMLEACMASAGLNPSVTGHFDSFKKWCLRNIKLVVP